MRQLRQRTVVAVVVAAGQIAPLVKLLQRVVAAAVALIAVVVIIAIIIIARTNRQLHASNFSGTRPAQPAAATSLPSCPAGNREVSLCRERERGGESSGKL